MAALDRIFFALSDPTRRAILEFLRSGDRKAGEVAGRFTMSWPAISRHLRILRNAGLILESRVGRSRYYTLNAAGVLGAASLWMAQFRAPSPPVQAASPPVGREYVS